MSETPIVTDKVTPQNALKDKPDANIEYPLAIDEFCLNLSVSDGRVELISGFHRFMEQAGKVKLTQTEFAAEFVKFISMPV